MPAEKTACSRLICWERSKLAVLVGVAFGLLTYQLLMKSSPYITGPVGHGPLNGVYV